MKTKRILVFLLGCIGTRLALTILAKYIAIDYLPYFTFFTIPVAISFMYLYIFGNDTVNSQLEWLGDKKIWWNELRPIHSISFMIFSIMAVNKSPDAWIILLLDTIFGLISWLIHHKILFFQF
jgi:hypothetical protein